MVPYGDHEVTNKNILSEIYTMIFRLATDASDECPSHDTLKRRATWAAIVVSSTLIAIKSFAWYQTNSVSLLSSLTDSILDLLASLSTMAAVHLAMKPADAKHRFGHGKIEAIGSLTQCVFILVSALFILHKAVDSFHYPTPLTHYITGIQTMIISLILVIGLVIYQKHVGKKTYSVGIMMDCTHYVSDILFGVGVIIALLGSEWFGLLWLDSVIAIIVAIYLLYGTFSVLKISLNILLDRELPRRIRKDIHETILNHPSIQNCQNVRTRYSGTQYFIQADIQMNPKMTLTKVTEVIDTIRSQLLKKYPHADVTLNPATHLKGSDHDDI